MSNGNHDSLYFRARSARLVFSLERQAIGIEAMDANGTSLILELSGDGPAALKADLQNLFEDHPQIADWKSPAGN